MFHCKVLYAAFVHFGLHSYSSGLHSSAGPAVEVLSSDFVIVEGLLFPYTSEVDDDGDYDGSNYRNEERDQKHFPSPEGDVI